MTSSGSSARGNFYISVVPKSIPRSERSRDVDVRDCTAQDRPHVKHDEMVASASCIADGPTWPHKTWRTSIVTSCGSSHHSTDMDVRSTNVIDQLLLGESLCHVNTKIMPHTDKLNIVQSTDFYVIARAICLCCCACLRTPALHSWTHSCTCATCACCIPDSL